MPWRTYQNNTYFYNKKRVNGQCRSIYVGNGPEAHAEAERVAIRNRDIAAVRAMKELDRDGDRMYAELATSVFDQLSAEMAGHGFHFRIGQWKSDKVGRPRH